MLTVLLPAYITCFSQGETNNWFIYNTRASISPSGVTTGLSMPTGGSFSLGLKSTSLSDADGNLQFACDGNTIIDKDLQIMPGLTGIELLAGLGKTLIQKIPGSTKYYVFYATSNGGGNNSTWTLKYLIVDLSLRAGKGDVITYNQVISTTISPSYTLVEDETSSNIWLVTHKCQSDSFFNYSISNTGLSNTPVLSRAGRNSSINEYVFQSLETSFDGKMIAGYSFWTQFNIFLSSSASIEVFDFDASTGLLASRVRSIRGTGNLINIFSLEFSADNRLLYVGSISRVSGLQPCGFGGGNIIQYNLCYTDSADFENYSISVAGKTVSCYPHITWGAIQMGADKRIHIPYTGTTVSTINNPNRIGTSSNFVFDSYQLPIGNSGQIITPDFQHQMMNRAVQNNIVYHGGCFPAPIIFRLTNSKITSIDWNFGDPSSPVNTINSLQPSHVFSAPGMYTVTARFINNLTGLVETINELIEIKDPGKRILYEYPTDTTICYGESVNINLKIINGLYRWYRLDNNRKIYASQVADSFKIDAPGMQYIEMRWNDCNGCVMIDSINVKVNPKPSTYLGNDRQLCGGDSIIFNFNETNTRYLWSTGETSSGITIKNGGIYWLEAEYNNNGCILIDSILVTDLVGVNFKLPSDTTLCSNQQLILNTGVTDARSYLWQDGSSNPFFTVSEPGIYYVQVTSADYCFKRDTIEVSYVNDKTVYLGNDTSLCIGNQLFLSTDLINADLLWNTGSTGSRINITQSGTYWLKATTAKCNSADSIVVNFISPPVVKLGNDTTICPGSTIELNPGILDAIYIWQDGSTKPTYLVKEAGEFSVTVNQKGCSVYDEITVNYYNNPTVDLGMNIRFCTGDSALLDAGPGFTSYQWSNGINTQQQYAKQPGVYTLVAKSVDGCDVSSSIIVMDPYPIPQPELGTFKGICKDEKITLDGGADFKSYKWNTGNESRFIEVANPGSYNVKVIDNNGCMGFDSTFIALTFTPPSMFLSADTTICFYSELVLTSQHQYQEYLWNTGSGGASLIITSPGLYWLKVKDHNGCTGSDSINVGLKDCMEGIYVPTAFTPNNDGKNDNFRPLIYGNIEAYHFQVYNRFGNLVYSSVKPGEGWDGSFRGQKQNSGNYVWKCIFKIRGSDLKEEKGTILLIR